MNTVEVQNSKFYTKIIESVHQVERKTWNECANFNNDDTYVGNPFLSHEFFCSLEDSGSVSKETGWISQHILLSDNNSIVGILPNFIKNHSWGEYIFDQVFAQAFENAGGKYYPKLLSAVPFSPVPGERFLIKASTLSNWASYSLEERVCLFMRRYPYTKISVYKLRKLYRKYKIRKK